MQGELGGGRSGRGIDAGGHLADRPVRDVAHVGEGEGGRAMAAEVEASDLARAADGFAVPEERGMDAGRSLIEVAEEDRDAPGR